MKKKIIAAIAAALALCSAAGCAADENARGMAVGKAEHMAFSPIEVTDDNVINSVRLFDAVSKDMENSMFSPLSLNMALGMAAAGAKGSTRSALDAYLGTDDYSGFAERYMDIVKERYNFKSEYDDKYNNVFEIANSFWSDESLPFKESYKQDIFVKFGAEIRNMDFRKKSAVIGAVNKWVNEKTRKMIPAVIDDYSDYITSMLINTVYFESRWLDEWSINTNSRQTFTLADGSTKELPLMYNGAEYYFENSAAAAFSCGYMNGLEFIGILPKQTGGFTVESLDIPSLLESRSADYDVTARMPRLKFSSDFLLRDALEAAGLSEIFDAEKADFSGIADFSGTDRFRVSEVLQKTSLELDENGTRAAAVTAMLNAGAAAPVEREKREVTLDRPFAFMIYDSEQEQIVFLGKVADP